MSAAVDQKAYLQKYLTGRSADKKKKKKKPMKGKGFKIIDDDLDLTKLRPLYGDELDIMNEGEDAPQVVGIIDERPEEIRKLEDFQTSSKWRVINKDDGFNSKLEIEEVKRNNKEVAKENEIVFGKMYSDSEDDNKNDSDQSPPRKNSEKNKTKNSSKSNRNSDSDCSPPRRKDKTKDRNYDSDLSPPRNSKRSIQNSDRNNKKDIDRSPQRRKKTSNWMNKNDDSDVSPPRKRPKEKTSKANRDYDTQLSPPGKSSRKIKKARKPSRWGDFGDEQENKTRRSRSHSPDKNNENIQKQKPNSDTMSYKQRGNDYDSDLSPPRRHHSSKSNSQDTDVPSRRRKSPDKRSTDKYERYKNYDRNNSDKARVSSPKNKRGQKHDRRTEKMNDSDSDLSPPRRERSKNSGRDYRNDEPPPSNKKMEKTLEGKKAGLQDAGQLKQENQAFRRREDEAFKHMTDDMSGRNAKAVSRKSKRETSQDRQNQKEKADRQKIIDEKYKKWSTGIKQVEAQQAAVEDFIHEASKPLARYKDDRDLEDKLRDIERAGDPMLQYMREKKRERGELGPEKPTYKGNFPANRFNIRPGYRWDGVDRSNGYEKKYFEQQSKKKAQEEELYKWNTEDL